MSVLRTDDEILEVKLGDVLLFHTDAAHPRRTIVTSAYTHRAYYTLFTDAGGAYTQILRGSVSVGADWFAKEDVLATVSTARKHRLWNPTPSHHAQPFTRGAVSPFRYPSVATCVGSEKNLGSEAVCGDCVSDRSEKTLVNDKTSKAEEGEGAKEWSLTSDVSRDREMLMITYGKGAPAYVKECLKMEKNSITLTMPDARYELSIDDTNTPAMFAVDATSGKRSKVVWSRAAGKQMLGGELQTVFPAALIFYPEAKKCLDAVIIGLVAWQQKMLTVDANAAL